MFSGIGFPHLVIFAIIILIVFGGKGKISGIMGDVAQGIKSFKKGMADDSDTESKTLEASMDEPAPKAASKVKAKS